MTKIINIKYSSQQPQWYFILFLSLINYQSMVIWFIGGIVGKYKYNSNPLYFPVIYYVKRRRVADNIG